jgi:hypothetical protein
MIHKALVFLLTFTTGAIVGHVALSSMHLGEPGVVRAQTDKPVFLTRLYTGPDNQTHAEELELKFTPGNPAAVSRRNRRSSSRIRLRMPTWQP